ncbi:MAG: PilW family protein [Janthinobacterium lividum]
MKRRSRGMGLVELMVSMLIGLIIVLGVTQIFISAKNTYLSQNASAAMQEDARYALSKMIQEIRMVGMFGCISTGSASFIDLSTSPTFTSVNVNPISYVTTTTGGVTSNVLTLLTGDVGTSGGTPSYTIASDCLTTATVTTGTAVLLAGQQGFPVRRVIYTYTNNQLSTTVGNATSPLINNVSAFAVSFGLATAASPYIVSSYTSTPATADFAYIRSVRITMTLTDPNSRVRDQTFNVVAALRNKLK